MNKKIKTKVIKSKENTLHLTKTSRSEALSVRFSRHITNTELQSLQEFGNYLKIKANNMEK